MEPSMHIADLERHLRIDQNDLSEELIKQPELVYNAAQGYAVAFSRRDYSKDELKRLEAEAKARYRDEAEGKITIKEVEDLVAADDECEACRKKLRKRQQVLNHWDAIKSAISARGYALRELTELMKLQYYTSPSDSPDYRQRSPQDSGRIRGSVGKKDVKSHRTKL